GHQAQGEHARSVAPVLLGDERLEEPGLRDRARRLVVVLLLAVELGRVGSNVLLSDLARDRPQLEGLFAEDHVVRGFHSVLGGWAASSPLGSAEYSGRRPARLSGQEGKPGGATRSGAARRDRTRAARNRRRAPRGR